MTYTFKLSRRLAISLALAPLAALACADTASVTDTGDPSRIVTLVVQPHTATIQVNDSMDFTAYGMTASGDSVTVSVSWRTTNATTTTTRSKTRGTGQVKGTRPGQTKVVAVVDSSTVSDTAIVTVIDTSIAQVTVSPTSLSLNVGNWTRLSVTLRDAAGVVRGGPAPTWSSTAPGIASVDPSGLVTGALAGSATVRATSGSASASVAVTVSQSSGGGGTGGNSVVQGTVSTATTGPVGGGTVQLLSGSLVVGTGSVDPTGSYSLSGIVAGSYTLRLHPNHAYSIALGETDPKPVTLQAAQTTTVNFVVQPALFFDDFQSYTSTSDLIGPQSGGTATGGFGFSSTYNTMGAQSPSSLGGSSGNITLTNEGPNGSKVMRYDFPDRTSVGCTSNGFKVQRRVHFNARPSSPSFYIRWQEKELPGWVNGLNGCGTVEYKHHMAWLDKSAGGTQEWGLLLYGTPPGQENINANNWSNALDSPTTRWSWADGPGQWHTWMIVARDFNTANAVYELWYDGVLVNRMTPPSGGQLPGTQRLNFTELGANINTGNPPMAKLWREYGVYATRPAELP